jgi:hypothetical protein
MNSFKLSSRNQSRQLRESPSADRGSAILEYLIFTLPLFLPLAIYLQSINQHSQLQFNIDNYARQIARAYVSSPSQEATSLRMGEIEKIFAAAIFPRYGIMELPIYRISCAANPCLTPRAMIEVQVTAHAGGQRGEITSVARQYVDAWRSG